jgi:thiol:disulfide interchange protein
VVLVLALSGCAAVQTTAGHNIAPEGADFTVVDMATWRGSFAAQEKLHLRRADSLGQMPYIELTAVWCGPCQAIRQSLGDPAVMKALRGTYIMRVDVDHWSMLSGNPLSKAVPVFIAVDSGGRWTTRRMIGTPVKPSEMAVAFDAFFHPTVQLQ